MPFKSQAQAKYMFAQHPGMAREWLKETGKISKLPKKLHKVDKAAKKSGF